jgi:kinetochore protein NDC80
MHAWPGMLAMLSWMVDINMVFRSLNFYVNI